MTCEQMENRIKEHYPEAQVAVVDMTGNGSNFEVRIHNPEFEGKSRIEIHQSILTLFNAEFQSGDVHAMSVKPVQL